MSEVSIEHGEEGLAVPEAPKASMAKHRAKIDNFLNVMEISLSSCIIVFVTSFFISTMAIWISFLQQYVTIGNLKLDLRNFGFLLFYFNLSHAGGSKLAQWGLRARSARLLLPFIGLLGVDVGYIVYVIIREVGYLNPLMITISVFCLLLFTFVLLLVLASCVLVVASRYLHSQSESMEGDLPSYDEVNSGLPNYNQIVGNNME